MGQRGDGVKVVIEGNKRGCKATGIKVKANGVKSRGEPRGEKRGKRTEICAVVGILNLERKKWEE